ncbi:MAG: DUF4957 domain-containing protein [Prevotella sp.]|nr:DUF4957 domain-containing protein [Prevotella sp.]
MKKLFAMATLAVAAMSANAQEVTPRSPIVPWGAQAEIIITNDLTEKYSDGSWHLTADAQKWVEYNYDGTTEGGTIQQTNRNNVWFDFYDETTDTMIVTSEAKAWGGYLSVFSKAGIKDGLLVVGKNRYPSFYVTGTDKAKFYFSGSASKAGYPQVEVYEVGAETPVATYTGDFALTKSTWDHSTLLIADGLDKAKSYKIVCRTMMLDAETNTYNYEGNDIVLQVVKFYGDQAGLREDGLIINGSELGGYINAHLAAYPEVTDFTLEGSGKYTIAEGIVADKAIKLTGVASAPATIDATGLKAPFVGMAEIAEDAEKDSLGFIAIGDVEFANVKIDALGQPLFSSNKQNYLVNGLSIDNSVIALTGNPFVIDFRNGGVVGNVSVNKSTIWAATATSNSFFTGQSGKKPTEAGLEEQLFMFVNSTLSNIATGKNFFTHRTQGQTYLSFGVRNSIFVNCGKDNFLASLNQGQTSANPSYQVEGITVLKTGKENPEDEASADVLININDLQSTSDETEEIMNPVDGVPFTLENALAGNFTLKASSLQAKNKIGDSRWLVPYATDAIKIEVDMTENTDFVAALNEKLQESEQPSSIEISFWEAGEYPTTGEINTTAPIRILNGSDIDAGAATIVVNNGMTLGGSIEFNGVNLKAGEGFSAPIITLAANEYKLQDNGFYNMGAIKFLNMSIKSGTQQILFGNKIKNQISELLVENCFVDIDGCTKVPFDFNGGGALGAFNIKKSTIWAANATESSLFSTQSGNKATEAGFTTQNFAIDNSTLYNVAKAKNFYTHRQANQTWLAYYLRNNIFVNVGKSGQVVKGINQGQSGKNPKWTVNGNAFFFDDGEGGLKDTSADESTGDDDEPVQNSISGEFAFNSVETPDFGGTFTMAFGSEANENIGDPRWTYEYKFKSPYYLVGNMTEWAATEAYNLELNPEAAAEEYMINVTLAADAQFKVVKVDGENLTWYPDGMGNAYGENGELSGAGNYTVYFRPNQDGNEDWFHGYLYVQKAEIAGDVNGDGQVGIGDIVAITNVMAGIEQDPEIVARANVNGDTSVGIGDIVAVTNIMAGTSSDTTEEPVEE